jgi:hypothetical protein
LPLKVIPPVLDIASEYATDDPNHNCYRVVNSHSLARTIQDLVYIVGAVHGAAVAGAEDAVVAVANVVFVEYCGSKRGITRLMISSI